MREKILAMTAGRTLDWMIAQDVMGINDKIFDFAYEAGNFNYSTNISAAWEVLEKLEISEINKSYRSGGEWYWGAFVNGEWTYDKSVPVAICKAALLAVMNL